MPNNGSVTTTSKKSTGPSDFEEKNGIEEMYKIYDKLSNASDKTTLRGEFRVLLEAVKRSDKEKRLASQFITRFLEYFPSLYFEAIDAMLDLCEDDDVSIRKQVCKDLVTVSKKVPIFVPKIADVFAQLLDTEDTGELTTIQSSLLSLFHIHAQGALVGLFSQISAGEEIVRERCFKFLATKLKDLSPEIVDVEFEKCLLSEARRSVRELSGFQLKQLFDLLMEMKLLETVAGQQSLVDLIGEVLEMDKQFDASEVENFDKLLLCSKHALLLFSPQVSATPFLSYYCTQVLPTFGDTEGNVTLEALEALRMMADIAFYLNQIDKEEAGKCIQNVYNNILELMPLPPTEEEENPSPEFELSHIESLLYTFHKLCYHNQDFLASDPDRLNDFRYRLQYLACGTHGYLRKLREDLQGKEGKELRTDVNRSKIQALKLTTNICAVIKDLLQSPPSYSSTIGLSWRPLVRSTNSTLKRKPSTSNPASNFAPKYKKEENRFYEPPSRKFSKYSNLQTNRGGYRGNGNHRRGGGGKPGYY